MGTNLLKEADGHRNVKHPNLFLVSWKNSVSVRSWSWPQKGKCPPQDREAENS
jgi:hypothetical protein